MAERFNHGYGLLDQAVFASNSSPDGRIVCSNSLTAAFRCLHCNRLTFNLNVKDVDNPLIIDRKTYFANMFMDVKLALLGSAVCSR